MRRHLLGALAGTLLAAACAPHPAGPRPRSDQGGLRAFASDLELKAFFQKRAERRRHRPARVQPVAPPPGAVQPTPVVPTPSARGNCGSSLSGDPARTVAGRVTAAENGGPLAGAQVRLQGTTRATVTDHDGRFRLAAVPPGSYTLSVSILGRRSGACTVVLAGNGTRRADFALPAAAVAIEGIVANALASQSETRSPLGASVSTVTNVQHQGVDEGGIVKVHGEHLVILRRGRLFTVRIDDERLRPVSMVNAYGPGLDPAGAWYDEMLISGSTIVVIGYSYQRDGSEIGLFSVGADGRLRYRSTHHIRSNDYYSSRNYASRLVGSRLIFYTPSHVLEDGRQNPLDHFPAIRRWREGAGESGFRPIATAQRVYRAAREDPRSLTLHTVTECDIRATDLDCEATVVMGEWGREFYVSPSAVYVWTHHHGRDASALVYRIPLRGGRPSALGASGMPIDQFSFLEDAGHLNVLVRSDGGGGSMWSAERPVRGALSLLRVPLREFADGAASAGRDRYRALPRVAADGAVHNRFVGGHLLYGVGHGWGRPRILKEPAVHVVPVAGGGAATLPLAHSVDRIEVMGTSAVVVGADSANLHFTGIGLGREPRVTHRYIRPDAAQGETRSHGFFYRTDDERTGVLGLPVRGGGRPGYEHLFRESASILYLRNAGEAFWELGALEARPEDTGDDGCQASCVDWYGNARPLFLDTRIFALLGYELVEGEIGENGIREVRRVSFAPRGRQLSAR